MIPNCEGCKEERSQAYGYQSEGLFVATSLDMPYSYPVDKTHYMMIIVDDNGKVIVG